MTIFVTIKICKANLKLESQRRRWLSSLPSLTLSILQAWTFRIIELNYYHTERLNTLLPWKLHALQRANSSYFPSSGRSFRNCHQNYSQAFYAFPWSLRFHWYLQNANSQKAQRVWGSVIINLCTGVGLWVDLQLDLSSFHWNKPLPHGETKHTVAMEAPC